MSREHGELRHICWLPDAECLEGHCAWCSGSPVKYTSVIARWAQNAGQVRTRTDGGTKDAADALAAGLASGRGPGRPTIFSELMED